MTQQQIQDALELIDAIQADNSNDIRAGIAGLKAMCDAYKFPAHFRANLDNCDATIPQPAAGQPAKHGTWGDPHGKAAKQLRRVSCNTMRDLLAATPETEPGTESITGL
jgi:hypothetical protein